MRVISDFYDYYDCAQALGQEQSIIYIRREEKIAWPEEWKGTHHLEGNGFPHMWYTGHWLSTRHRTQVKYHVVGFCGKIYPVVMCSVFDSEPKPDQTPCMNDDDLTRFFEANNKKKDIQAYHGTWNKGKWRAPWPLNLRKSANEFFQQCRDQQDKYRQFFLDNMCPIFVTTASKIVLNARLKSYGFVRVFDPYTAFQELSMFTGGVLGVTKHGKPKYAGQIMSSEVSDKDLAAAKGFDKFSFRKDPSKKK